MFDETAHRKHSSTSETATEKFLFNVEMQYTGDQVESQKTAISSPDKKPFPVYSLNNFPLGISHPQPQPQSLPDVVEVTS